MNTLFNAEILNSDIGTTDQLIAISSLAQFLIADCHLIKGCRRELLIQSKDLEPLRFNQDDVCDALSAFARSDRNVRVLMLVADPRLAHERGHALVKLAQRLPSFIKIRQAHDDDQEHIESFMVADGRAYIARKNPLVDEGFFNACGLSRAPALQRRFHEQWERSREIANFRVLSL